MLSKESEKFLRELRIELMTRGKDEAQTEALENELRDHLIEAEADGKTLDDVTNGSVDNYIDTISKEVVSDKRIIRTILQTSVGLLFLFTIPELLNGSFNFTLSHMIYLILLFVLGPLAIIAFTKHIIVEHVDFIDGKIDKRGYAKLAITSVLFLAVLVGGIFLYRTFPIYTFLELDVSTTRIIGYLAFGLGIIVLSAMKEWILLGALFVISLPNIFALLFTSGNPQDQTYIIVSLAGLFVLWIVFLVVILLRFKKDNVEE